MQGEKDIEPKKIALNFQKDVKHFITNIKDVIKYALKLSYLYLKFSMTRY